MKFGKNQPSGATMAIRLLESDFNILPNKEFIKQCHSFCIDTQNEHETKINRRKSEDEGGRLIITLHHSMDLSDH